MTAFEVESVAGEENREQAHPVLPAFVAAREGRNGLMLTVSFTTAEADHTAPTATPSDWPFNMLEVVSSRSSLPLISAVVHELYLAFISLTCKIVSPVTKNVSSLVMVMFHTTCHLVMDTCAH